MQGNLVQGIIAAVVLVTAGVFLVFAYTQGGPGRVQGYTVSATFADAGGLAVGGDVRMGGLKIGSVIGEHVDPATETAVVQMSIEPDIRLPADTLAAVQSESLTGGAFIELKPGHSEQMIAAGGTIAKVKNYQSLEATVGNLIFSSPGATAGSEAAGTQQESQPKQ